MNSRICQMIRYLFANINTSVRLEDVAAFMDISVRMVRNYCSDMEKFFGTDSFLKWFRFDSGSIAFTGTKDDMLEISSRIRNSDFYRYKLSSEERRQMIFSLLLCNDTPLTVSELCDLFFTSRGTILRDIDCIREDFLLPAETDYSKNKLHGFSLDCSENKRRALIYREISKCGISELFGFDSSQCEIRDVFYGRLLKVKRNIAKVKNAVQEAEKQLHISMTDTEFYCLLLYMIIAAFRIESGHFSDSCDEPGFSSNGLSINFAEYIFKNIGTIPYTENELQQLAQFLKKQNLSCTADEESHELLRYYFLVRDFLLEISKSYSVDLLSDSNLNDYLVGHMLGMYHRIQNKEKLDNPLVVQIQSEYKSDFEIVKRSVHILGDGLGVTIDDDEAAYILMHIIVALERVYSSLPDPDVIIACNTGMATANFLAESIRKQFSVNIVSVTSSHNVERVLSRQRADLIICTVPLRDIETPSIQVSLPLSDVDLTKIKAKLDHISRNLFFSSKRSAPTVSASAEDDHSSIERAKPLSVCDLLTDSHILLDREAGDWKESIITAGEPLLWDKTVSADYLSAMVANMLENGPYFVFSPHVAIAHANPKYGAKGIGMTFLRLKAPISFGHPANDPVKFVIAVSMFDSPSHVNLLFKTMNLLCNSEILSMLEHAANTSEVRRIIGKYEKDMKQLIG